MWTFSKIKSPSTRLIALLVEATSRARRNNGDVKIINLSFTARENISSFAPASYLCFEPDDQSAVADFGDIEVPETELIIPATDEPKISKNEGKPQEEDVPAVDIVEDPIIEKIQSTFSSEKDDPEFEELKLEKSRAIPETNNQFGKRQHLRVTSDAENLYSICDFATKYVEEAGLESREVGKAKIAVYEACLNIIEHAYHSKPDNFIDIWVEYDQQQVVIEIRDYGLGFEGIKEKAYDVMSAMDGRQTGGFGLYIIRRSMDEIEYTADPVDGNTLRLTKYLNDKTSENNSEKRPA